MKYTYLCLSLVFVGMLLVPGAYAFSSETSSTGTITNDSFTAILYADTAIMDGSISYKVVDGANVILPDIFTLISGANLVISGSGQYTISFEAVFSDDNGTLDSESYLFINGEPASDVTLDAGEIYTLQLNVYFPDVSFSGTLKCTLTLVISAQHNDCTYCDRDNCAVIEVHDDPIAELIDITEGEGVQGSYEKNTITASDGTQVIISNSTNSTGQGVADSDGNINVVLNIPANTPFCIKIWNREDYNVRANIEVSNIIVDGEATSHRYNNQKLGSGFARYFCHYYAYSSEYWSTTHISYVQNNDGWFYSSSGQVTISIDAHYDDGHGNKAQNVRLCIVFKDV